ESKYPGRGDNTASGFSSGVSSGVQSIRFSDVAIRTLGTLKYIQYLPFTLVATRRFPSTRLRIAPDLYSTFRYFPPAAFANTGPCFSHVTRSRDVATARRGMDRFHCV